MANKCWVPDYSSFPVKQQHPVSGALQTDTVLYALLLSHCYKTEYQTDGGLAYVTDLQ